MTDEDAIRNTTWDELQIGASARIERTCSVEDLFLFAHASGNVNPLMLPAQDGRDPNEAIAPSLWVGSLVSAVLGNMLPGAGTLYLAQNFRFGARVHPGDRLSVEVRCAEKREKPVALFDVRVTKSDGALACAGVAEVAAPVESIILRREDLPAIIVDRHDHFDRLVKQAAMLPPIANGRCMAERSQLPDGRPSIGGTRSDRAHFDRPALHDSRRRAGG